jgi:hypothetical protein
MFGIGKKNQEIIDEAALMLEGLAEDVSTGAVGKLVAKQAAPIAAAESFVAPIDDVATRPIDLPGKPDSELF